MFPELTEEQIGEVALALSTQRRRRQLAHAIHGRDSALRGVVPADTGA